MAALPAAAKIALFLLIYPPLFGALLSLLFWAWGRLKKRPPARPVLLEASSLVAFLIGGLLSFSLWGERYLLIHVALPFLSFRLDAATGVVCVGAGATAALGMALGEKGALQAAARLGLVSLVGFCATSTHLPLLTSALVAASFVAFAASNEGKMGGRTAALRLFAMAVGLALVGGGLRIPVAWCEEGDLVNLSDLTGYVPLRTLYRSLGAVSLGLPLAFLLPLGEAGPWAVGLLSQAAGIVLARFCSISLPAGAGESCGLCPSLAIGAFLGGWALLSAVERRPLLFGLARGGLLLALLCALHGRPPVSAAGLFVLSAAGPALSAPVGRGWKGAMHRVAIALLPPFVTGAAGWLAASALWDYGTVAWLVPAGMAWASGAAGAVAVGPSGSKRGYLFLPLALVASSPLPLLFAHHVVGALTARI